MDNIYLIIGLALIVIFTGWTLNMILTATINSKRKHTLFTGKYMDFYSFLHGVLMDNEIICSMDYSQKGYIGSYDA